MIIQKNLRRFLSHKTNSFKSHLLARLTKPATQSFRLENLEPRCYLSADSLDLVLLTELGTEDPLYSHLQSNYFNINSITADDFASLDSSSSQQVTINNADLIIVSPDASDSRYDGTDLEVDSWNALQTPIIILDAGIIRNNRWNFIDATDLDPVDDTTETLILDSTDLLFNNVNIQNDTADLFITDMISGDLWVDAEIADLPGGTVLGTAFNFRSDHVIGIARMNAGAQLVTPTSTGSTNTLAGDRLIFGIQDLDSLTSDGLQILDNAFTEHGLQNFQSIQTFEDAYTLYSDVPWSESEITGILANDNIFIADPTSAIASIDTAPSNGNINLAADGSFTYTPNPGFLGTDTFTYTVSDGVTTSAPQTVTLEVIQNPVDFTVTIKEVTTLRDLKITPFQSGAELQIDPYDYDDPILTVDDFSPELAGSTILQTSNYDIDYHGVKTEHGYDVTKYVRLHLNQNATVYVSYDHQFAHLPEWLGPDQGWKVVDTFYDNGQVFAKSFEAGDFWLGANDEASGGFIDRAYNVVIQPLADEPINNVP